MLRGGDEPLPVRLSWAAPRAVPLHAAARGALPGARSRARCATASTSPSRWTPVPFADAQRRRRRRDLGRGRGARQRRAERQRRRSSRRRSCAATPRLSGTCAATAPARSDARRAAPARQAAERLRLSARAVHRVLRVARTIADLGGPRHVDESRTCRGAAVPRRRSSRSMRFRRSWLARPIKASRNARAACSLLSRRATAVLTLPGCRSPVRAALQHRSDALEPLHDRHRRPSDRRRAPFHGRPAPALAVVSMVVTLPVLIGMGAAWKAKAEVAELYASHGGARTRERQLPRRDRRAHRRRSSAADRAFATWAASAALDPALQSAMDKLPGDREVARHGRRGRGRLPAGRARAGSPRRKTPSACCATCSRASKAACAVVQSDVDKRNALAAATPSIWPAHGLAHVVDRRPPRPVHGRGRLPPRARHLRRQAARRCTRRPTAPSCTAGYSGAYGNLVVHRPRLRPRDALRPPVGVHGRGAATTVKRGDSSATSAPPAAPPAPTSTTKCASTAALLNPLQFLLKRPPQTRTDRLGTLPSRPALGPDGPDVADV